MADSAHHIEKGDSVKIKRDVKLPDSKGICIGGWQGRVISIEKIKGGKTLIDIEWDSITLEATPIDYIRESEVEGLDYTRVSLYIDEVEPARPRDSEEEAQNIRGQMANWSSLFSLGEAGDRILEVIGHSDLNDRLKVLNVWKEHLNEVLSSPFEARVDEFQERGPFREGDEVKVLGIVKVNELMGVIVKIKHGWRGRKFPLCDLEVADKKSPNYLPVKDYRVWLDNC